MIKSVKYCLVLLVFMTPLLFICQEDVPRQESGKVTLVPAPFSIRSEFSSPTPLNSAWRKCMVGVAEANISVNYKLTGNFFIGVGYKFSLLYTPPKFFLFTLKTKMQMNNLYIKIGYDFYRSNNYFITPSINSGICFTKFTGVQCLKNTATNKTEYSSWFIEPQLTFNFLPEKRFGISFHVSYVFVNHVWDPYFICMQDWISLTGTNTSGMTGYLNFGFGLYIGAGLKKN